MRNTDKKSVVVTGGLGFIGSHLVDRLIAEGYFVHVVDNMLTSSGSDLDELKKAFIEHENFEFWYADAQELNQLLGPESTIECVFHLGEYSRVNQSNEPGEDLKVFENNTWDIASVIAFCQFNQCKLIYAGSSTKFHTDSDDSYEPTPYEVSKKQNSELVHYWCERLKIPYAIPYFYNVYGPRERAEGSYGTVIAKFIQAYKNNQPFPIVKPGSQRRNFTHVNDIINGLMLLMDQKIIGDEYCIGSDTSFALLDLAKLIDSNHPIEWLPKRAGDRTGANLDTTEMKRLGWREQYSLPVYLHRITGELYLNRRGEYTFDDQSFSA